MTIQSAAVVFHYSQAELTIYDHDRNGNQMTPGWYWMPLFSNGEPMTRPIGPYPTETAANNASDVGQGEFQHRRTVGPYNPGGSKRGPESLGLAARSRLGKR